MTATSGASGSALVSGSVSNGTSDPMALVHLPPEAARALVTALPAATVADALMKLGARAGEVLALVPAERVAYVLVLDRATFDPNIQPYDVPQGHVERITRAEAERLRAEGHGELVRVLDTDIIGNEIAWGFSPTQEQVRLSVARDRLDAILESGNDAAWKRAALRSMPFAYWALALRASEVREDDAVARIAVIAACDPFTAAGVRIWLRYSIADCVTEVMMERDAILPDALPAIAVSEEGAAVMERLRTRESAKALRRLFAGHASAPDVGAGTDAGVVVDVDGRSNGDGE